MQILVKLFDGEIPIRCTPWSQGVALYKLYRYVKYQRVWFLSCFGLKLGIDLTILN